MQVAHESPLALLETSRFYNDYDYALVHLFEKYPQYLEFFRQSKRMGRKVLLDNSMFELREAFEAGKFAQWIVDLKPDEFIVPDVFSDSAATIANFESWKENFGDVPGKKIGVIQGKTYQEIVNCYKYMSENADKIAISFECSYFHTIGYSMDPHATIWERLMDGRQSLISDLIRDDIWSRDLPHHLLGCSLPQEFRFYNDLMGDFINIESIDTSNPIVAGMCNLRYNEYGLKDKITTKLADMLENQITDENLKNIYYNIKKFREINRIK